MSSIKKVKGLDRFVDVIAEYTNGLETSAGLYKPEELEDVDENIISVTYDSDHATMLPVDWYSYDVLDDNNKRQKIKEIHWKRDSRKYEMADGTFSEEVTL